jgi:hypothetical protein
MKATRAWWIFIAPDQDGVHRIMTLTDSEKYLLTWLAKEDYSQYGECYGSALDGLISKGLAEVHSDGSNQAGFIAQGKTKMYFAVSLTEKGRAAAGCAGDAP